MGSLLRYLQALPDWERGGDTSPGLVGGTCLSEERVLALSLHGSKADNQEGAAIQPLAPEGALRHEIAGEAALFGPF